MVNGERITENGEWRDTRTRFVFVILGRGCDTRVLPPQPFLINTVFMRSISSFRVGMTIGHPQNDGRGIYRKRQIGKKPFSRTDEDTRVQCSSLRDGLPLGKGAVAELVR